MAKSRRGFKAGLIAAIVALWGILVYVAYDYYRARDQLPTAALPDLDSQKQAGKISRVTGAAFQRVVLPEDFQRPSISEAPKAGDPAWAVSVAQSAVTLGTLFHVRPQGLLQIGTQGNWLIAMDGEGEFILEDARTNPEKTLRTISWLVKKGMLRARPSNFDKSEHWLQIRAGKARVVLQNGELGIRVPEGAGGQVWLMSGKATVYWNDGRRKELPLREMQYL